MKTNHNPPSSVREITGDISKMDAFGIDPADYVNDAARLFVVEWCDRKGWYEQEIKSGLYYATVANDTEEFKTAEEARAWLFERVEKTVTEASLCDEFKAWTETNKLPFVSADELIHGDRLTPEQRHWLTSFILIWEQVVEDKS